MRIYILSLVLIITGCTTKLWSTNYQEEQITGFFVNPTDSSLLVSTNKYGYIFPITDTFSQTLTLSRTVVFKPRFQNFSINSDYSVNGSIFLSIPEKRVNKNEVDSLINLGFVKGKYGYYYLTTQLTGTRYDIEGKLPFEKLEGKHIVRVEQPDTFLSVSKKIVATPVAVAYDAVVIVPSVFILVLVMSTDSWG